MATNKDVEKKEKSSTNEDMDMNNFAAKKTATSGKNVFIILFIKIL